MLSRLRRWLGSTPDDDLIESLRRLNDELEGLNMDLHRFVPQAPRMYQGSEVEKQSWEYPSFDSGDFELRTQTGKHWTIDRGRMRVTIH